MFNNIIGHQDEKKFLINTIKSNNISHSYLFLGKEGIGKKKIALEFCKQILNVNNLENCPDFKLIEKKQDKNNIIVEQIREEILKDIYVAPISSNKKVYIINDFEDLNTSAQNALLKTLEEPPSYVVIILISSKLEKILPTIVSRVNIIKFNKISNQILKEYISKNYSTKINDIILDFFDGSIGMINILMYDENIDNLFKIDKLYNKIIAKDYIGCIQVLSNLDLSKEYSINYLMYLFNLNNNHICVNIINKAYNNLKNNGNYDITIDNMILKCIDNC